MGFLGVIKDRLNTGKTIDADKIISSIKDFDVVSFDIFDTLLKRDVKKPSDVFEIIEKKLAIPGFANKRIYAEKIAREKKGEEEITISDIYAEMEDDYHELELNQESELLRVNIDMLPVFEYCVQNKRVVLSSDMYLPENFVSKILQREGIIGYEKLYLSSSLFKRKYTGTMFKYIIDDLKIEKTQMVHIGDSFISDLKVPKSLGIACIHIPTYCCRSKLQTKDKSLEVNIINSFINNTLNLNADDYYKFGYEKFGKFLWGYSKWLHESVIQAGINKIYFFSRDGLLMKNAFDSLFSDVKTYYLEVSRRSLRVPILWMNYKLEHVLDMISPSKLISLTTIFDGVGLDIDEYSCLLSEYGFDATSYFERNEILKNAKLLELYNRLAKDIEKVSKIEYELLVKYIKQNKIEGRFAIVDIGWSGGMQRYLCETLDAMGIKHEITGFYIGVADYYKRNKYVVPSLDLNGYLFDFSHNCNAVDKRSSFVGLFETLFLEQAGSVKNYFEIDGLVKGYRMEYEYLENGKPTYELSKVRQIQKGALEFVRNFGNRNLNIESSVLFKELEQIGINPSKKDLDMFADFRFFDEGEIYYLANPNTIIRYILHPKEFKRDFLLSRWKIGFMKRLLKLSLPYDKMYRYMLKFK